MLEVCFKKQFKKDLKHAQKQQKNWEKLKNAMEHLINQNPLHLFVPVVTLTY